jgi:AraC-like DNA-binding protein
MPGRTAPQPAWRLSTETLPPEARNAAWNDAMRRLRLPLVTPDGGGPMQGEVTVVESPMGLQFALIDASPQKIEGRSEDQVEGLWVSILLEGEGRISGSGFQASFIPGRILCGISRNAAALAFAGHHRQLLIQLPAVAIAPRLLAGLNDPLVLIEASEGTALIFRRLLEATAQELVRLDPELLRPVELSVIEFLVATLASAGGTRARGGADGARAALLHRIMQRVETMLGDPDLSITSVAEDAGISPRYLRRLLAAQDMNFATILRQRRLERCHADLVSPLHSQLSISAIAFRWGFSDAAHFSRTFRERFGISPREHRRAAVR